MFLIKKEKIWTFDSDFFTLFCVSLFLNYKKLNTSFGLWNCEHKPGKRYLNKLSVQGKS